MPFTRRLKDLRHHLFYGALLRRNRKIIALGNRDTGCAWNYCPDDLNSKSIIYSGGVGRDTSFEHGLVRQFGCSVILLDPSPTGAETMALAENRIPQFTFLPVGLAGTCGTLKLAPPEHPEEGSWFKHAGDETTIEVPCKDLATLMLENGHRHIDLLKIDIEGAEYEVMDGLLKKRLPVKQVLVEFHHDILSGIKRRKTVGIILKMIAAGYKLLDQEGANHTFLKP
ncbi:MAG: FkbM family methyltransferase [Verrucomicrobiota bacterium]